MRLPLATVPSLLLLTLTASPTSAATETPAAAPPLLALDIAPAATIAAHFQRSFLAAVWNDPAVQPLHALLQQGLDRPDAFKAKAMLAALLTEHGIGFRLLGLLGSHEHPDAACDACADFGTAAGAVFEAIRLQAQTQSATPLPTPAWAGADAALDLPERDGTFGARLGRFGPLLRLAHPAAQPPTWLPDAGDADVRVRVDLHGLFTQLLGWAPPEVAQDPAIRTLLGRFGQAESSFTLVAAGLRSVLHATVPCAGLVPIDRAKLSQIPTHAREVAAIGIDGSAAYQTWCPPLLACAQHEMPPRTDPLQKINDELAGQGLPSLAALCAAFRGTCLFIATPGNGSPIPGYTLVLPRSHGLDQLAQVLVAKAKLTLPPVGTPLVLPLGQVNAQLLRTDEELVLTTDAALAAHWPDSGWTDTALGNAMLARVDQHTVAVTSGDTPAEIKDLVTSAGDAVQSLPIAPEQQQAVRALFERIARDCKPAWNIATVTGDDFRSEGEGIGSISGIVAGGVTASVAVPLIMAQRQIAAAAARPAENDPIHTLRAQILPAEVQYQAGAYHDHDQNGIGEYGFFTDMSSAPPAEGLALLPPDFHQAEPVIAHYHYRVFLPADATTAEADPFPQPRQEQAAGVSLRERYWVAYAWPEQAGGLMYAIDQRGDVFATPFTGTAPAWNALYGGAGATWATEHVAWQPAPRPGAAAPAQP